MNAKYIIVDTSAQESDGHASVVPTVRLRAALYTPFAYAAFGRTQWFQAPLGTLVGAKSSECGGPPRLMPIHRPASLIIQFNKKRSMVEHFAQGEPNHFKPA
jgi:hypothetical protein